MAAGVSLLSDLPYSTSSSANSRESSTDMEPVNVRVPTAKYTKVGETLRHVIPGHMQCSMACGGRACKYENPSRWSDKEQAIKGLYSSWITDNLLAMARPSTETIEKFNVIEQFHECGLKTVINLQRPGEHASCGSTLESESGFTYRPEVFMEAGIYFYNFGWKDYGVASLTTILDMVKVMSFAVQEGKMAVHCHAGLGRTGVLIACFLVFTSRMSADQAILFVRAKRPNSIQTRGQLLCVREFAQFLVPLRSVFSCAEPKAHMVTLSQYLTRQRHLLHGYEARLMKNVPKIVHLVCRFLLDIAEDRQTGEEDVLDIPDLTEEVEKTVSLQALQQLGKEMRGKGIPISSPRSPDQPSLLLKETQCDPPHDRPLCSDQEFDVLWRWPTVDNTYKSQLILRKCLSYSDSALNKLDPRVQVLQSPQNAFGIKSGLNFTEVYVSQSRLAKQTPDLLTSEINNSPKHGSSTGSCSSLVQSKKVEGQVSCSPVSVKRAPPKETKRSMSYGFLGRTSDSMFSTRQVGKSHLSPNENTTYDDIQQLTDVPILTLQSELSPETRHLFVAKALTMDIDGEDLRSTVSTWQTELNSREGVWERLCTERDPVVLSMLMWSWLEQLKEPVITKEDVETLAGNRLNPQHALNSLDKGQKQTLLCILDCAAHLLQIPEEVENAFFERTIKAFTWISSDSENGQLSYKTLKDVMIPVLNDLRTKAMEDLELTCHCFRVH
ncbi:protein tyrosine phosphatase domain-containing protein 1 isoform X2 [Sinocyclocheilus grahami]|uniref:Protein tyrosine phosphatase domain-containing protein 1 n=2 Tax=Sinocyclocheilus grahami TaxID=75366 RepID=A0A672M3D1_SINGR|nr:PREDICTED: protein tyrosine phosphatase domain-containing protein 1 isoform X2 [Sinocyclocheilus grahami]XP_016093923.1 PREDICTED: protein tyrosine phosphatase domain-containing protein 1 isoform X2 [Sinocyclocheilus grahami]XP_016093931.1 PREDICTED: protein tyrosine phosphatase domain-containing protein 1 isoform X2 [Sinocyclocheilus grahami]